MSLMLMEALNEVDEKRNSFSGDSSDVSAQFFDKLANMGFNLDELQPFIECNTSMLGVSGAGSGKTTALVLKIIYEFVTGRLYKDVEIKGVTYKQPKKILVSTFLKSGAADVQRVFTEYCNKLGVTGIPYDCITFGTLHSEFFNIIKTMTGVTPKITTQQMSLVRNIMQEFGVRRRDSLSTVLTAEEVSDMCGLITCFINRLDDESKYDHSLVTEFKLNKPVLDTIVNRYRTTLAALDETDFDLMQELLYNNLGNQAICDFIHNRYDVIFIDEFQDTSRLQYAILKEYIKGCERVVAIGDDDQCIYSWRGSEINIINKHFLEDVNPAIRKLSTNYRCREKILNAVIPCICKNENRQEKTLKAAKPGGELVLFEDKTGREIIDSVIEDLEKYKTIGIISRTNNDLLVPAIYLELKGGIDYQVSGNVSLDSRLTKTIFSSIELITKRYTDNFPQILKSLFRPFAHREVSKLCSLLRSNMTVNIWSIPSEDLYASVPSLADFLLQMRDIKSRAGEVAVFQAILWYYIKTIFVKDTPYNLNGRSVANLLYGLFDKDGLFLDKDIYTIERLLLDELPKRISARAKPSKHAQIKLSTVHDAKGKEWDAVYIYNFVAKVFPSPLIHGSQEEFEEERRIAYIAWTRAKEKLVICTSAGSPSCYLKECDLSECIKSSDTIRQTTVTKAKTVEEMVREYITNKIATDNMSQQLKELLGVCDDIFGAVYDALLYQFEAKYGEGYTPRVGYVTEEVLVDAIQVCYNNYCDYE